MSDWRWTHRLGGCTPTPLADYLKALGILRLLSSAENNVDGVAADCHARGWWQDECFHLRTNLDREALLQFFLEKYAPSPVIGPWNGRAGFLEGDAGEASARTGARLVRELEATSAARFAAMQEVIMLLRGAPTLVEYDRIRAAIKAAERRKDQGEKKRLQKMGDAVKSEILPRLRAAADERHLPYLDACFVLADGERPSPLLGSGGNDGSRDFGVNFAEALSSLFDLREGRAAPFAAAELDAAIVGGLGQTRTSGAMGQFGPGQGGVNATTGYEGYNPLNQWDILLAIEGTLLFVGALTRRWGVDVSGRASFPFTLEPTAGGAGSLSSADPNRPRGEIWTPLWRHPARFQEVRALFSEGRLTVGGKTARSGLDAARAIAGLGISRGVASFERYSLIQPDAKMPYQATPLGRFHAPGRPEPDLVASLDAGGWLTQVRRLAQEKAAPARAREAVRRLEDALFDMTQPARRENGVQAAIIAIGEVVSWIGSSPKSMEQIDPPPLLPTAWVSAADDYSPEFAVATALASIGWPNTTNTNPSTVDEASMEDVAAASEPDGEAETGSEEAPSRAEHLMPMAVHFAPADPSTIRSRYRKWRSQGGDALVVWGGGGLVRNLVNVLERRLIEQSIHGLRDKPLNAAANAPLADVLALIEGGGAFDDRRCASLLAGLVWARPRRQDLGMSSRMAPFAYAALKLVLMPDTILRERGVLREDARLPVPAGLVPAMRCGAVDDAIRAALTRARGSGITSPFDPAGSNARGTRFGVGADPERMAAALIVPIPPADLEPAIIAAHPQIWEKENPADAA